MPLKLLLSFPIGVKDILFKFKFAVSLTYSPLYVVPLLTLVEKFVKSVADSIKYGLSSVPEPANVYTRADSLFKGV